MSKHANKYDLYGIGSALVDMEVEVSEQFQQRSGTGKGHMMLVDEARQRELISQLGLNPANLKKACGGSAANTVISNSAFGGRAFFSCALGNDQEGHFYRDNLTQVGVHSNAHMMPAGATGKCLVMITPDGERTMNTFLGVNEQLSAEIIDQQALATSTYLYLEGYLVSTESNYQTLLSACTLANQSDTRIILSLSNAFIVQNYFTQLQKIISTGIAMVFCNEEEALLYSGCDTLSDAIRALSAQIPHTIITRGKEGAVIHLDGATTHIKSHPVKTVDTNGAGDVFAGAYLYGISHGLDIQQAGDFASLCAARLVSCYGPRLAPEEYQQLLASIGH